MIKLLITSTTIALAAGILWGQAGVGLTAVVIPTLLAAWFLRQQAYVRVPEMEVAIVYNTQRQAFSRFLPPGGHWLWPFSERIEATITTAPASVQDRSAGIQSSGGLTLTVAWGLNYTLNPFKVPADTRAKAARTLPRQAGRAAGKHMANCLQHVIGEYTIEQLCQPGAHKRLEREVRQLIAERLAPLGFEVARVMIGAIEMPPQVQAALEAAQERQVKAENEARALARLQQVISQFSDADMQRLMELERIHALGQNGVTLLYPADFARDSARSAMNSYTRFAANRAVVAPRVS